MFCISTRFLVCLLLSCHQLDEPIYLKYLELVY